jgi:hypothetical protein
MPKSVVALFSLTAALIISVAGCGGGGSKTTSTSQTATTTANPSNSTTQSSTTQTTTKPATNTTTTGNGNTLPQTGVAITTHSSAVLTAYKGLCQTCHGKGLANSNPYPPTWDGKASGSTHNTGVYPITPGSPADHTSYTMDECTKAGCHAVSGSTSTTTTNGKLFIDPEPGGKPIAMTTHPLVGFENCVPCHVGSSAVGSNLRVSEAHGCDECHATEPEPAYDPGHEGVGFPTLPMQTSCIICHKPAAK